MKTFQSKTTGCDLSIRGEAKQNLKQPQMSKVCYHDFINLELKTWLTWQVRTNALKYIRTDSCRGVYYAYEIVLAPPDLFYKLTHLKKI